MYHYKTSLVFCCIVTSFLSVSAANNDNNIYLNRTRKNAIPSNVKLIDEPVCDELKSLCNNLQPGSDDLLTLECIQTFLSSQVEGLNEECQHVIWSHTVDILDDKNVKRLVDKKCTKETVKFSDCKETRQPGHLLSCIINKRETITNAECLSILQRLEWVAFSDFKLIGIFMRDCEDDVNRLNCGRLNTDNNKLSQGLTIACLQNNIETLSGECKKGVLKLSEFQGDNIRSDRQLFLACSNDAIRFCPDVKFGSGLVYKCLLRFRNDPLLSKHCGDQLLRRDKLIASDYKVSRGLVKSCRDEIKLHHCRRGVSEDKDVRVSQIILCLETVAKNNTKISAECQAEINDHRKMLMEDFHLTPEIVSGCDDDIQKFCNNVDGSGKTIHCLMDHARSKRKRDRRLSVQCLRALEDLVKVVDAGEDWRVDPVLHEACKVVVDTACPDLTGGNAKVMSCLMEKISTQYMTESCKQALLQIQYFISRDFKLDPQLYRACKRDAVKFCRAKKNWADTDGNNEMDPERGPLILPCLHRTMYHKTENDVGHELSPDCAQEVKRVMRQRAISVDLIPEVEDECLEDLSNWCLDKTKIGEELTCLQDNLSKLLDKCKAAVISYTEDEARQVELNPVINLVCKEAMNTHCSIILNEGKDEGEMMECLISHKNDPDLRQDAKCRAAIEHFQIISLKNYYFTYKFKEACRPYVMRFCPKSNTKFEVVACLSEVMRNDTINGQRHSIPKECRQQVRAQLYQQRENIDFDPKLKSACHSDIEMHCADVQHGGGQVNENVLECLQTQHEKLSEECQHVLFTIKRSELSDSSTDYVLMNICRDMIKIFCQNSPPNELLECLKIRKEEPKFDPNCHKVVVNRMIEQNLDYRFNPALQDACKKNINDYCTNVIKDAKQNEELDGKVVECLKKKFREGKLTKKCEKQMVEILHEQALNYKLNPLLQTVCKDELQFLCKPNEEEDDGGVEECLKDAFLHNRLINKECRLEVATMIQEAKADIHVDPILQTACTHDLLKYCSGVASGNGRRLRCLQIILQDESKALDEECKTKIVQRMEMYKNAEIFAPAPENLSELYSQVVTSPAKRYFLLMFMSCIGFIFMFGIFCGRVGRRSMAIKNK